MNRPRAKKVNKFKKRNNKHKEPHGKMQVQLPRELPKNEMEAKVHLITQDIKFAQALAGNDKKIRDKFLKNLKQWLSTRSSTSYRKPTHTPFLIHQVSNFPLPTAFSDQDFLRLWKGLFYCMWMSDKPLIQEQLCEDMGSLFYCFESPVVAVQFYGRFLETVSQEWLGIDHWRLDKFMQLVRRVTRHLLRVMHKHEWTPELLKAFRKEITGTVFKEGTLSFGCTMHYLSLFWEEVAKVTEGQISARAVTGLIKPFLSFLTDTHDQRLSKRVVVDIFYGLLKQSDLGRQHEEKYEVWKQFGFPSDRISDMELIEDEDEDKEEEEEEVEDHGEEEDGGAPKEKIALDPRAGNVSVVLPEIVFNARKIHQLMEKAYYDAGTRSANRRVIKKVMANYEKFFNGQYPLGVQRVILPSAEAAKLPDIDEKVGELDSLQEEVLEETRMMKTLSKSEKKRYYQSGMSRREYLESLGRLKAVQPAAEEDDGTNGMMVVEEEVPKTKKKRKLSKESGGGDEKKQKKSLDGGSTNGPMDLDNGFEVEAVVEKKLPTQQQQHKESPKEKQKAKSHKKTTNGVGGGVFNEETEWDKPLEEGEVEFLVTPTKQRLKHLNGELEDRAVTSSKMVKNPFATNGPASKKQKKKQLLNVPESPKTPVNNKLAAVGGQLRTPNSSGKRVKIMLEKNMAQEKSEYFRQLRNSPQIPFDSTKKPTKGLLKPNSMPSPINPYYKKQIGLKLDNE